MTTPDDIDALAGEYVLGTLDAAERAAVAARRQREPVLDAAIQAWERQLAPLDTLTQPIAPQSDLLARIEAAIASPSHPDAAVPVSLAEVARLKRSVALWRRMTIAATAAAACLLAVAGVREVTRPAAGTYVGVFQKGDVQPVFILSINLERRELTLRPVSAEPVPGKTYQLWIASDSLGPAPLSLGLVDQQLGPTRKSLTTFDKSLLERATFGVSLEPAGGSPTGRPTAPALHTKLMPATL